MQHIHSHTLHPYTNTHNVHARSTYSCSSTSSAVSCTLCSAFLLTSSPPPSAFLASLVLRPRLSSLVPRPRLVSCCCWLIRTFACPSAHVFIICVHCAIVHCPLCRVLCHSHIIKVIISSLSPTSAAAAANCARSCSLSLFLLLFIFLYYSLSLSVALSGSPRLQLAKGHRVRFVISASNKTHPFANTRRTLDNRHPIPDTYSIWDKDMRCSSSST